MASDIYNDRVIGISHPPGVQALSVSVAGSADVTLSAAQLANGYYTFTGVITGNMNVIFPALGVYPIPVFNSTTGAFTLTVKATSGTGIVVATAKKAILWFDGTNVVRWTADI